MILTDRLLSLGTKTRDEKQKRGRISSRREGNDIETKTEQRALRMKSRKRNGTDYLWNFNAKTDSVAAVNRFI